MKYALYVGFPLLVGVTSPRSTLGQQGATTLAIAVTDAETRSPLVAAEIVILSLRKVAKTDTSGHALITGLAAGEYSVRVRRLGYDAVTRTVTVGDSVEAVFALKPVALRLDPVAVDRPVVPVYLQNFEARRSTGIGRYLTAADLAKESDRELAMVLTSRFPGLRLVFDSRGKPLVASSRSNCGSAGPSVPRLDGRAPSGGGETATGSSGSCFSVHPCVVQTFLDDINLGELDFDIVRTWDLAGVEYYTGASMPPRYRVSGSACGVLLLWSKQVY